MDPIAQSNATVQKTIASLLDAGDTHQKLASVPLPSLLSAGLSQQTEIVTHFAPLSTAPQTVTLADKKMH